jgi:CubicO group peptidase (beta-lactamase class C family)
MTASRFGRRLSRRRLVQIGGGAAAAGIAATAPIARASAQSGTPVAGADRGIPAEQVDDAVARIEPMIADALTETGVPGLAIAVVHNDNVVWSKGFGVKSVDGADAIDTDTVFQIASVSKSVAATVVAAAVGDGTVTWDDHLVDHIPDFQLSDPWITREVSIRDAFSHRTGMPGTAGDDLELIGYARDEIIHRMRDLNLTGTFRQTYSYSNFGLTAGGEAAAAATGKTWEDLSKERLYAPLGMTSTSSRYSDFETRPNRALLHTPVDGAWVQGFTRNADAQSPAGGVSSTINDLTRWMRMILGGGTLDGVEHIAADALASVFVPQIFRGRNPTTGASSFYGLGWGVEYDAQGRVFWSHAGAFSVGARTYVSLLPEANLGIVVLTNAFPTGLPEGISAAFYDLAIYGELQNDWIGFWNGQYDLLAQSFQNDTYATAPTAPEPALAATAYTGTYKNDYFGVLTVESGTGDALSIGFGPGPITFPLTHWDRDLFIYEPSPEFPGAMNAATFLVDPDGQASRVVIEALDSYGQGTFTRVPAP